MRNKEKAILVATMKLGTRVTMIANNDDKDGNKNIDDYDDNNYNDKTDDDNNTDDNNDNNAHDDSSKWVAPRSDGGTLQKFPHRSTCALLICQHHHCHSHQCKHH